MGLYGAVWAPHGSARSMRFLALPIVGCTSAIFHHNFFCLDSTMSSGFPWMCQQKALGDRARYLLSQTSAQNYYLNAYFSTKILYGSRNAEQAWGLATDEGELTTNFSLLCSKRGAHCGPPHAGLHSLLVTSNGDHSNFLHLPQTLVEKVSVYQ